MREAVESKLLLIAKSIRNQVGETTFDLAVRPSAIVRKAVKKSATRYEES